MDWEELSLMSIGFLSTVKVNHRLRGIDMM